MACKEYVLPDRFSTIKYPYIFPKPVRIANRQTETVCSRNVIGVLSLDVDGLVIELGSNDGYLLSQFQSLGVSVCWE